MNHIYFVMNFYSHYYEMFYYEFICTEFGKEVGGRHITHLGSQRVNEKVKRTRG